MKLSSTGRSVPGSSFFVTYISSVVYIHGFFSSSQDFLQYLS